MYVGRGGWFEPQCITTASSSYLVGVARVWNIASWTAWPRLLNWVGLIRFPLDVMCRVRWAWCRVAVWPFDDGRFLLVLERIELRKLCSRFGTCDLILRCTTGILCKRKVFQKRLTVTDTNPRTPARLPFKLVVWLSRKVHNRTHEKRNRFRGQKKNTSGSWGLITGGIGKKKMDKSAHWQS